MTEPLRLSFRLDCSHEHAFEIWTARTSLWWPADRADATEVEIVFAPAEDATTDIRIVHSGWERLGARGDAWRDRNRRGWETLLPWYVAYCERGGIDG